MTLHSAKLVDSPLCSRSSLARLVGTGRASHQNSFPSLRLMVQEGRGWILVLAIFRTHGLLGDSQNNWIVERGFGDDFRRVEPSFPIRRPVRTYMQFSLSGLPGVCKIIASFISSPSSQTQKTICLWALGAWDNGRYGRMTAMTSRAREAEKGMGGRAGTSE